MKKNIFNGICAAAVCMALTTLTPNNQAQAATTSGDKANAAYFQDSTMQRGKMNSNKGMGKSKMGSGKMNSDSTGKMGNMKGKNSGGYKSKGMGKSKMDTTSNK